MEIDTNRTGAFYKIMIWIQTITTMPFVHFVYCDIQSIKVNKWVNREKNLHPAEKSINLGYHNGGTCYAM